MSYSDSFESICTVLTCASEEYEDFFAKEELLTEVLSDDTLHNIIRPNSERLRAADGRYRLDDLLYAMLKHVPHPLGRRYVAICLHIAHQKGEDSVVNAAKAWLDNLLLPSPLVYLFPLRLRTTSASVFALSRYKRTWPASSQTCNGHYNRTPDLGKCGMWWNVWDLARHTILDVKVLDHNVTWLTKHKDTS